MKSIAFVLVLVAVFIQNAYTHVIKGGPCGCKPALVSGPVYTTVAQPSVASSLADTLSLLTVSSLLAESLPLTPNVVATVPVPVSLTYGCCGCGGCGCDGCGCDGCCCGCSGCGCGGCGCGGCGCDGCCCGGCGCGGCGCGGCGCDGCCYGCGCGGCGCDGCCYGCGGCGCGGYNVLKYRYVC